VTYEELNLLFPHIQQAETDGIWNEEAKFFVWAEPEKWGFSVVPVTRINEELYVGDDQFFPFENDTWVLNFFDGTH